MESSTLRKETAASQITVLIYGTATVCLGLSLSNSIPATLPLWGSVAICLLLLTGHGVALWLSDRIVLPRSYHRHTLSGEQFRGIAAGVLAGFALNPTGHAGVNILLGIFGVVSAVTLIVLSVTQEDATQIHNTLVVDDHILTRQAQPDLRSPLADEMTVEDDLSESGEDERAASLTLIRHQTDSGESIEITAQVEFAANQRQASIDIPLTPALTGLPEVECEPLDETDLTWKVGAAYPYGVRVEFRRSGDVSDAVTVPVGIQITGEQSELREAS